MVETVWGSKSRNRLKRIMVNSDFRHASLITAQILNEHYAAISTDMSYQPTQVKLTAAARDSLISEVYVFRLLDTLKHTATGLDGIPAWFLRLGAPIFAAPLDRLFNQTIMEGTTALENGSHHSNSESAASDKAE